MKTGVLGLGYVGIVNVACISNAGHTVYCTDVKKFKIHQVQEGRSPIREPEVDALLAQGIANGSIIPTEDIELLVRSSDVLIVCVGTPSKPSGEVNLSYLGNAVAEIAQFLKPEDKKYLVFRSTVPPGTTEEITNRYLGDRFPGVVPVFYPEFLREGTAVKDYYNYGRFVIGKKGNADIGELINLLHVNRDKSVFETDLRTAEFSKYVDNGFHALKVAFANEIFGLASDLGVDVDAAHQIFISDDKLNVSPYYLRPGMPFGGSCLPKDVRELQFLMNHSEREFHIMRTVIPSNDAFVSHLLQKIKKTGKQRITFIGVTFKNHSDDLRESPVLRLINELLSHSDADIRFWDDDISMDNIRVDHAHLYTALAEWNTAIEHAELIVVSKRYLAAVLEHKKSGQIVLNFSDDQKTRVSDVVNLYG